MAEPFRPTVVIETWGSTWAFDEHNGQYRRAPKVEGPRAPGPNGEDWGGSGADPGLQDWTWHPYSSWEIGVFFPGHGEHLAIFDTPGGRITAPGPEVIVRYHD